MIATSDAFLILPGGLGTLDEFFEVVTTAQLGMHTKPIVLVNTDGYFDPLFALLRSRERRRLHLWRCRAAVSRGGDAEEAIERWSVTSRWSSRASRPSSGDQRPAPPRHSRR